MLVIALVLALIGLVALVFAVVTSNELVAWVCIAASVVGVVLLILDALRERQQRGPVGDEVQDAGQDAGEVPADEDDYVDYPEEGAAEGEPEAATEATEPTEESGVAAEGRSDEPAK